MKSAFAAIAFLFTVAACGGSTNQPAAAAASPSPSPQMVTMTETEFAISPKTQDLKAGSYVFHVVNGGNFKHDLHLMDSSGQQVAASQQLSAGQSEDVPVTLKAGSYSFFCAVDSHKDRGMQGTITVT